MLFRFLLNGNTKVVLEKATEEIIHFDFLNENLWKLTLTGTKLLLLLVVY